MTTKVVVVFDLSLRLRPVCWIVVCPKYQLGIAIGEENYFGPFHRMSLDALDHRGEHSTVTTTDQPDWASINCTGIFNKDSFFQARLVYILPFETLSTTWLPLNVRSIHFL